MEKSIFYKSKKIIKIEWFLNDNDLPSLTWARLRIFQDDTADVCLKECTTLYGFIDRASAGYFLNEDEYIIFENWDEEDENLYKIKAIDILTPNWNDKNNQIFEYIGKY